MSVRRVTRRGGDDVFNPDAASARDYALFLRMGVFTHSDQGLRQFREGFIAGGEAARRWWTATRNARANPSLAEE